MDQDKDSAEQNGYELPPTFWEALTTLDASTGPEMTGIVTLYREFPAWGVWLPRQGCSWTAARPTSARPPHADLQMIWVHAETATELADRMRSVDWQLS